MTELIIGKVYEIDNHIKIAGSFWSHYFAKFIGFAANNDPVFEANGRFFAVPEKGATITELADQAP